MSDIEISVVVPIYNEEGSIRLLIERVCNALNQHKFEIVIVNDGSTDRSDNIIKKILQSNDKLRYLSLTQNMGQSQALYCGFQHTRGRYVVMMDGDLQNPPEEILPLVNKARDGYDLVSGRRDNRQDSFVIRKLPSAIANWYIRKVMGSDFRDIGGMNCLRGEIARSIVVKKGYHRLIPVIVHCMGKRTTEIPVHHNPRTTGSSKYGFWKRSFEVIIDVIELWFTYKVKPIYFFGFTSLIFTIFSFICFYSDWLASGDNILGVVHLVIASILLCCGIICQLLQGSKSHCYWNINYDSFSSVK